MTAVTICKYCPTLRPLPDHVWRQHFHHLTLSLTLIPTTSTNCTDDISWPSSRPHNPFTPSRSMCAGDGTHAELLVLYFLCLISLGTYGLLIVRVCTLFRSSYSWVRWKNEAPTKLMKKNKNKKKLAVHTKMKSKYAHFGPFLRIFFLRH